jgi:GT2 family glycosyltransferase
VTVPQSKPITIIIPAHNQLHFCRNCIESLREHTRRSYHLVLIDNGSTDGVSEYFDTVPGATVIHSNANLGFAGGVNLGLAVATGHVVLLNSDTLLAPGWLNHLELALTSGEEWGAAGPVTNCASGTQELPNLSLGSPAQAAEFAGLRWAQYGPSMRETRRLAGFCLMLRDSVWQRVGDFDTRFGIGNYEDDDYCTRIRQLGYRLGVAEGCFVYHFGGRTFEAMGLVGDAYEKLLQENRRKYSEKWDVYLPDPAAAGAGRTASLRKLGEEAVESGDLSTAIRCFRDAIKITPDNPDLFYLLGEALLGAGQPKLALETFAACLKLSPRHPRGLSRAWELAASLGSEDRLREILGNQGSA